MSPKPLETTSGSIDPIDRLVAEHRTGHGLARPFYHDPDVFERDMERVFQRHWHCIAHASVIPNPGDLELFKLGDEQIILTRSADGQVHALVMRLQPPRRGGLYEAAGQCPRLRLPLPRVDLLFGRG